MKYYQGFYNHSDGDFGRVDVVREIDDKSLFMRISPRKPLPLRLDLRNHSPTGFAWGYGGSGPAQLSLAILADAVGDQLALKHYMSFKQLISRFPMTRDWGLSEEFVKRWIEEQVK